jgi:hypothetical protein
MNVKFNNEANFTTSGTLTVYLVGLPFTSPDLSKIGFYCMDNEALFKYGKTYNVGTANSEYFYCFINKMDALEYAGYRFEDGSWLDSTAHIAQCVVPDNTVIKFGSLVDHNIISIPNMVITPALEVLRVNNIVPELEAYKVELKKITEGMPLVEPLFFEE